MCNLDPGPPGDAHGASGAQVILFVTSADDPMMAIQNATVNGGHLPVSADGRVTFAMQGGQNLLRLVLTSGSDGNEVVLTEQCEGGETNPLKRRFLAGGTPVIGFDLRA